LPSLSKSRIVAPPICGGINGKGAGPIAGGGGGNVGGGGGESGSGGSSPGPIK